MTTDELHITRAIELAKESLTSGNLPFGALIVYREKIIAEATNTDTTDPLGHAEANVIRKLLKKVEDYDLSEYTLYSNFEPCAMCSFLIRDFGIGRVVFSVHSPHWGGVSKWNILNDSSIADKFKTCESDGIPEIIGGILEKEGRKIFDELGWQMHLPSLN